MANIPVGDHQTTKNLQPFKSFITITASLILGNRSIRSTSLRTTLLAKQCRRVDELLKSLVVVLDEKQPLGLLDDVPEVFQKDFALIGELAIRVLQLLVARKRRQGDIDLLVGGELAIGESLGGQRSSKVAGMEGKE